MEAARVCGFADQSRGSWTESVDGRKKPGQVPGFLKLVDLFLAVAAFAMGCGLMSSPPAYAQVLLAAQTWNIQYSPGMPAHPIAVDSEWYFDFPAPSCGGADVCSVHYVSTPVRMSITTGGHINAVFQVTTAGAPVFNYRLKADNTCDYPAHVRFYLQRRGDDRSGQGEYEFYRWF